MKQGHIILGKNLLNILLEDMYRVESSLFYSRMVQGKNEYLKMSVLQLYVIASSEFWDL